MISMSSGQLELEMERIYGRLRNIEKKIELAAVYPNELAKLNKEKATLERQLTSLSFVQQICLQGDYEEKQRLFAANFIQL